MSAALPRIIVSAGEPAGIGPDLCLGLALQPRAAAWAVIADPRVLDERRRLLDLPVELALLSDAAAVEAHRPGRLQILPLESAVPARCGQLDPRNAAYVLDVLRRCADACLHGEFDALVTAPVQKSIINDAGFAFSGHTEFLASHTKARRAVMMLAADQLRVALATTHLPLSEVPGAISRPGLTEVLRILHSGLGDWFDIAEPRILVCGLNPHAGEGGHLGDEETRLIGPVVEELRATGMRLSGPLPADTAFTPARLAGADAVLAMYHDQGLPVLKHAGFGAAVNITLGLPILRTSVDHGTALSLAGTGGADHGSLAAALEMAITLAPNASAAS